MNPVVSDSRKKNKTVVLILQRNIGYNETKAQKTDHVGETRHSVLDDILINLRYIAVCG